MKKRCLKVSRVEAGGSATATPTRRSSLLKANFDRLEDDGLGPERFS